MRSETTADVTGTAGACWDLVAWGTRGGRRWQDEIKDVLGADGLLYQSHEDLIAVGTELNPAITRFEDSCFTGARMHI